MKNYILSVVAAAVICVIAGNLISEKTPNGQILKLLCGILMTITALSPLFNIGFDHIENFINTISTDASLYVDNGEMASRNSIAEIIKSQTEAYILDKASAMGLDIAVEVQLDDSKNQIPCGVTVSGAISPFGKARLSDYISQTLGIPEAKQEWT